MHAPVDDTQMQEQQTSAMRAPVDDTQQQEQQTSASEAVRRFHTAMDELGPACTAHRMQAVDQVAKTETSSAPAIAGALRRRIAVGNAQCVAAAVAALDSLMKNCGEAYRTAFAPSVAVLVGTALLRAPGGGGHRTAIMRFPAAWSDRTVWQDAPFDPETMGCITFAMASAMALHGLRQLRFADGGIIRRLVRVARECESPATAGIFAELLAVATQAAPPQFVVPLWYCADALRRSSGCFASVISSVSGIEQLRTSAARCHSDALHGNARAVLLALAAVWGGGSAAAVPRWRQGGVEDGEEQMPWGSDDEGSDAPATVQRPVTPRAAKRQRHNKRQQVGKAAAKVAAAAGSSACQGCPGCGACCPGCKAKDDCLAGLRAKVQAGAVREEALRAQLHGAEAQLLQQEQWLSLSEPRVRTSHRRTQEAQAAESLACHRADEAELREHVLSMRLKSSQEAGAEAAAAGAEAAAAASRDAARVTTAATAAAAAATVSATAPAAADTTAAASPTPGRTLEDKLLRVYGKEMHVSEVLVLAAERALLDAAGGQYELLTSNLRLKAGPHALHASGDKGKELRAFLPRQRKRRENGWCPCPGKLLQERIENAQSRSVCPLIALWSGGSAFIVMLLGCHQHNNVCADMVGGERILANLCDGGFVDPDAPTWVLSYLPVGHHDGGPSCGGHELLGQLRASDSINFGSEGDERLLSSVGEPIPGGLQNAVVAYATATVGTWLPVARKIASAWRKRFPVAGGSGAGAAAAAVAVSGT